ncbi:MAG: ATP-dependent rRNA helicase RRP3 [Amphiamblys sp. WSBS2006]|nr:MAG: ATP-dependent rRNA helicase RRP3 [Amphiamblys sp. WSBS2006]
MADESFASLGLRPSLCEKCTMLGYESPTEIQRKTIPHILAQRSVVGLASTGSGKTAAFVLPILDRIIEKPRVFSCCVVAPSRELAIQIEGQFRVFGNELGLKSALLVGGLDVVGQAIALSKKPHVIVCTPGRLVEHLETTKGFGLKKTRFLVIDEADQILEHNFEEDLEKIVRSCSPERQTLLFSATMSEKVETLRRTALRKHVFIKLSERYETVDQLAQFYLLAQAQEKEASLVYLLREFSGGKTIVFCKTRKAVQWVHLMLTELEFNAECVHGDMNQEKRMAAMARFRETQDILVATDVASRGLDIDGVDCVINQDIPRNTKDYIHRVGRTARAGRAGRAITIVTQYTVGDYQDLEKRLRRRLERYSVPRESVQGLLDDVVEAGRYASAKLKD